LLHCSKILPVKQSGKRCRRYFGGIIAILRARNEISEN